MTTHSKAPKDNTALFLSCAQEWTISSTNDETDQNLPHTKKDSEIEEQNNLSTSSTQSKPHSKTVQFLEETHSTLPSHFPRFYSHLHTELIKSPNYSSLQCESNALTLIQSPHKCYNWHLYLMPEDDSKKTEIPKNSLQNDAIATQVHEVTTKNSSQEETKLPNKELKLWLQQGISKGWLRHVPVDNFTEALPNAYLAQDIFWQRFSSKCDCANRVCLVLFQFPEMRSKKNNEKTKQTRYLRELIEQILLTIKDTDFFGEIKDFGVALVLNDCGSFSATASAERILTRLENILKNSFNQKNESENLNIDLESNISSWQIPIQVAVAEKEDGENADTLFAHAKEVIHARERENMHLAQPVQAQSIDANVQPITNSNREFLHDKISAKIHPLRVHVYKNTKKTKEKNSLVQSDEKRFLFFGVH